MKVGISTASLFPEKHSEEAASLIKEWGVDVTEIFFSTFYEYRPEFARSFVGSIEGLEFNSVHTMPQNFEQNLFNSTRRVRGDGFYWLDQVARSAQILNCSNYTFHGQARLKPHKTDDFAYIGERFAEIYDFLQRYGINLCLENTAYYAFNRPSFFAEIRKYCPDLRCVFDVKQARRSGYPYEMYLKEMQGAIAYCHISDVDEKGQCRLPGSGIYDFKTMFSRLKDAGFDGNILIEVYRRNYKDVQEVRESFEFLSEICYKMG